MTFDQTQLVRTLKRLASAEGYLELRMSRQALESLQEINEPGPLRPMVEMLRGKAYWLEQRFDDAARSLQFAARHIHAPHNREAWLALSIYYRDRGRSDEAIESLAKARGAMPPKPRRGKQQSS